MTRYVLVFLVGVVLAAIGQLLLKLGAVRGAKRGALGSIFHGYALAGYALMLGSTVTSTLALRVLPLKTTVSLLPLGYIIVVLLSIVVLGEKMSRAQFWGMVIIMAGILVFHLGAT